MIVFGKTPKGLEEIKSKAHGLSMIERRVLIYIDGKRTVDQLKTLPRVTDLDGIINLLKTEGYITNPTTQKSQSPLTPAYETPLPQLREQANTPSPFRELPETFQPEKFNMAKNFMTNTLNHFKGFYGATRLVRDIDECQTHEELRALYNAWCESIDNTRQGKKQGEKLRRNLLDVL